MPNLTESELDARVEMGKTFCKKFAGNDRHASAKFRDASLAPSAWYSDETDEWNQSEGGDVPTDVAIGVSNQLTTNILTKCASIAYGDPDWAVTCGKTENEAIVREFMREKWRHHNWIRLSERVMQKHCIIGLGILAYRWDDVKRSTFEFVQSWDLFIDPNTTDFSDLKWGGHRIKMSLREAMSEFGAKHFPTGSLTDDGALDRERVSIWLYYDDDKEVYLYDGKQINKGKDDKNLYGTIPLLFHEGDIDPGTSIWPLGDSQLAAGLQAELTDINTIISRTAKHGGPLDLVDLQRLGKAGQQALEDGVPNGFIPVDDLVSPPIMRLPGTPLTETLLEAKRECSQALDGATGVNQYMRGVISQSAKFATEAAYVSQQSGARGTQSRRKFERFLNRMAEIVLMLEVQFGGPRPGHSTDEEFVLWEALKDVQEIYVIENSTSAKDPAQEAQTAMTAVGTIAQIAPLFQQMGLPVPNMQQYVDDWLRASGHQDVSRYWIDPAPQSPQGMPPQGMPQQGQMPPPGAPAPQGN